MEQFVTKHQKKLRCGITTGTCAAAAAEAAATALLLGIQKESVLVHTPKGIEVSIPVTFLSESISHAEYFVIKDSGDDPDVTNHAEICVRVQKLDQNSVFEDTSFFMQEYHNLYLDGGIGVGRVTRAGLEQSQGQAAINVIPRTMIFKAVSEVCKLGEYQENLLIVVSIPQGEKLAKKTFNERLGIEGGLSILGTSGMIEPMSEKAIIDTIELQIRQLQKQGIRNLLITPGNYGQSYAANFLKLKMEDSIKCSNYIGDTLDLATVYGMHQVLLVGNIGKLVKLAAGIMNTHSKIADGRCEIFATHTVLCGGTREMIRILMHCINTEEMLRYLEEWGLRDAVIQSLCTKIKEHLIHRVGENMKVDVVLFSEKYGYLGQTEGTESCLDR